MFVFEEFNDYITKDWELNYLELPKFPYMSPESDK